MKSVKEYIESGLLESYILGYTSNLQNEEITQLSLTSPEIREELDRISDTLQAFAESRAITPSPALKPFILATIDYTERMRSGEVPANPPVLHNNSKVIDYSSWLNRPDLSLPGDFKDFHARIIGNTPGALTAIIWISEMAPQEVHATELERFLIVEGSCAITIEDVVHHLHPGDFLSIPLHKKHHVKVTSAIPCKVILQRIAA